MKPQPFDDAYLVKAWLDEPVWLPESDLGRIAQLVRQTPQQRGWLPTLDRRSLTVMSTATKFIVAGGFVAIVGGFILSRTISPQPEGLPPAAATATATPTVDTTAPSAAPTTAESTAIAEPAPNGAIVMTPSTGRSFGGWTEIGRADVFGPGRTQFTALRRLQAVDDRLVALGAVIDVQERNARAEIFHSTDGMTWLPATVPGNGRTILDLAKTSDGLLAAGSVLEDGERRGSLWSSADGSTWTEEPAPPFTEVTQIVSSEAPLVVVDQARRPTIWRNDGIGWTTVRRLNDFSIARGPAGFLMWRGGGRNGSVPTRVLHSADAREFVEVELPRALTRGDKESGGMSIFALDDQWVLVPVMRSSQPDMFTSSDGLTWAAAPRPHHLGHPNVGWMAEVDGNVQAFYPEAGFKGQPGLQSWTLGDPVEGEPAILRNDFLDVIIYAPVRWLDGYAATGRGGQKGGSHLTFWRYEPPETS
jgi:hypothetical protein